MSKSLNRRQLFQTMMVSSGALALSAWAVNTNTTDNQTTTGKTWNYVPLDTERTAALAYQLHNQGKSCMYGVFSSIVKQLAEKVGEPFRSFPCEMMVYGAGGVAGWGTLCGALNGGAAAISLLIGTAADRQALTDELFLWYQDSQIPTYVPESPFFKADLPVVKPDSVLCHPSVSAWIKKAKVNFYSKEREERCTRLSADTARKTVELLNRSHLGSFTKQYKLNGETVGCLSCHGKDGIKADMLAKSCAGCHSPSHNQHP